ncbi:MAG: methyltransferase domain-containing protein [Methanosarcinales archaeon]|nr:methyltransferase domain-containing protein [Methanosarcinales archaeon]
MDDNGNNYGKNNDNCNGNMRFAFELSGEHETLASSEVSALLSTCGIDFSVSQSLDCCLIIDAEVSSEVLERISDRLGLTHTVMELIDILPADTDADAMRDACDNIDFSKYIPSGETFVVRTRKVKNHPAPTSKLAERKIGAAVYMQGYSVNLKRPDCTLRAVFTDRVCVLGKVINTIDRTGLDARAPGKKPFFHPGVLMPKIARAIVNIAGAGGDVDEDSNDHKDENKGIIMLDPFCGTCGVLLEAGMTGARMIGIDAQNWILQGARMNLEHFGYDGLLINGDAKNLPLVAESVDAIITDPPYGISSAIKAESLNELRTGSFAEMYRVLKSGKKVVVVADQRIEKMMEDAGFEVVEIHEQRVHRSLNRYYFVLEKNRKSSQKE